MLEFDGGLQAHVAYGGRFPLSQNSVVVYGSRARLVAEGTIDVATHGVLRVSIPQGHIGCREEIWQPELVDHYRRQIEAFSRSVADGAPFSAGGADGLRSVQIADAVVESYDTGRRVSCTP
jgi:predicted dehydrogenase